MNQTDAFEQDAFTKLNDTKITKSKKAFMSETKFEQQVSNSLLTFDTLKKTIPGTNVSQRPDGSYRIKLSKAHIAFDLKNLLQADNEVGLEFSEDFNEYKPDDEIIQKSSIPLWVLKNLGGNTISIQRVW